MNSERLWKLAALAACAAALVQPSVAAGADAPLSVTSPAALTAEICDQCSPQAFLPLTIAGAEPSALNVQVVDVSRGDLHDASLVGSIHPKVETLNGFPALLFQLDAGRFRDIGTYKVTLRFAAAGVPPVAVTVQLVRPAATLQPVGPFVIERVRGIPWDPVSGQPKPSIVLLETSGRTGLSHLTFPPTSPPPATDIGLTHSPRACPGEEVTATQDPMELPAGATRCLPYDLPGPFALGTRTQTHTIAARELQSPVAVTFEVRSRLWRGYVLVYALAGLLCSLFLKVVLQRRLDLSEARLASTDLVEHVQTDLDRHLDRVFRAAVQPGLTSLQQAMGGQDVAAIAAERTSLEKAWRDALESLATRRQAAQQKVDDLRGVVETPWQIPSGMAQALGAVTQAVTDLRELVRDDVGQADDDAKDLLRQVVAAVDVEMTAWQDAVPLYLTAVVNAPDGVSPDVKRDTDQAVTEARSGIGVARLGLTATVPALLQALQAMSEERRTARKPIHAMAAALDQEIDRAVAVLRRSRADCPDLVRAVAGARSALFDGIDRPESGSGAVSALQAVGAAWRATLTGQFGNASLPPEVEQPLADKRYVEAAIALRAILAARLADDTAVSRDAAASTRPTIVLEEARSALLTFRTALPGRGAISLRAFRAGTRREIVMAKTLQTLIVALLAALIGYGLFAPKFIGDYQDFVVIFFWAFALDLSVDAAGKLAPTARR